MHRITIYDIYKAKDDHSVVTLASHADKDLLRKLEYDYLFKAYTIHTENGTITTDDVKEAAYRYNTGDMILKPYNGS